MHRPMRGKVLRCADEDIGIAAGGGAGERWSRRRVWYWWDVKDHGSWIVDSGWGERWRGMRERLCEDLMDVLLD
jgi:hypothetical protein